MTVYIELVYTAMLPRRTWAATTIIYGGLGNDFLHGGAGDDAISGAAPLPYYYGSGMNPLGILSALSAYYTPGDVLGFDPSTGIFRYYDPSDPYSKIVFNVGGTPSSTSSSTSTARSTTATTSIFGDLGNDWIVGGTGHDTLWGGWGNDLLQADDNLDSTLVASR